MSLLSRLHLAGTLGLQKDEAFYAVWARAPDAAYAWVPLAAIRVSTLVFGESPFAVRLPFVLAMTAAGIGVFALARRVAGSPAAAAWSAAFLLGNVWSHFAGAQAHPDAFLAACWIGALALLLAPPDERSRAALYGGAFLAAGAALSKYTGFLLWPAWIAMELLFVSGRGWRARELGLATLLWLALVSPAVAAMVGEEGHWLRVVLELSDLSGSVPAWLRVFLVPIAPLLYLASPGALVFFAGPWAAWRSGGAGFTGAAAPGTAAPGAAAPGTAAPGTGRVAVGVAASVILAFALLAARGGLKGNWVLPALWGTLPFGVAWFLAGRRRTRCLAACALGGIAVTALAHVAAVRPEWLVRSTSVVAPAAALDRGYEATVSPLERRHATSRVWVDRAFEWSVTAPLADSLSRRARRFRTEAGVASDLYEVVYALRFHEPRLHVRLLEDRRFRTTPEFARGPAEMPRRLLYVTAPGVDLPESFFLWYRFLERDSKLVIAKGQGGERQYEVWKCGVDDEVW